MERRQVVQQHRLRVQPVREGGLRGVDRQIAMGEQHSLRRAGGAAGELDAGHVAGIGRGGRGQRRRGPADEVVEGRRAGGVRRAAPGEDDRSQVGQPVPDRGDPLGDVRRHDDGAGPGERQHVGQAVLAQERVDDGHRAARADDAVVPDREDRVEDGRQADHRAGLTGQFTQRSGAAGHLGVQLREAELTARPAQRRPVRCGPRRPARQVVDGRSGGVQHGIPPRSRGHDLTGAGTAPASSNAPDR